MIGAVNFLKIIRAALLRCNEKLHSNSLFNYLGKNVANNSTMLEPPVFVAHKYIFYGIQIIMKNVIKRINGFSQLPKVQRPNKTVPRLSLRLSESLTHWEIPQLALVRYNSLVANKYSS